MLSFWSGSTELLESICESDVGGLAMAEPNHKPVMLQEVISLLNLSPGKVVVDATLGLGGHAFSMIEKIIPDGFFIGIDKDEEAIEQARARLKCCCKDVTLVHEDFRNLGKVIDIAGVSGVDAVLFDLGVSSYQLECADRGFSIKSEGPLDMRMDRKSFISAYDLVNTLTEEEISSILWKFGEERYSRRIARVLVSRRMKAPISSTKELADLVVSAMPHKGGFHRIHPATRTFQALRIAVNRELDALEVALKTAALYLNKCGRICVISFHSLEDRIVKDHFRQLAATGHYRLVFKKILRPSEEETQDNPRSRSARMRMIERMA
jgi:16S rRNA (cytosine1402-N4)-methyltransferase